MFTSNESASRFKILDIFWQLQNFESGNTFMEVNIKLLALLEISRLSWKQMKSAIVSTFCYVGFHNCQLKLSISIQNYFSTLCNCHRRFSDSAGAAPEFDGLVI